MPGLPVAVAHKDRATYLSSAFPRLGLMTHPLRWLVQPLWEAPRGDVREADDLALGRHLAWRRSVLVLVIAFTALTAAIDTAIRLAGGPQFSFNFVLRLGPTEGTVEQTWFGDLADLLLRATLSAWRHQREFLQADRAKAYNQLMEKLDLSA